MRRSEIDRPEIIRWLNETVTDRLGELWARADRVRRETVGDALHLRGLIEVSNHCVRQCHYCGIRAGNRQITRYRMTPAEILDCAREAVRRGYGTVVLQAGEDPGLTRDDVSTTIRAIKRETQLAVTLSLGEREDADLLEWKQAGADRYLLRFETSNRALYDRIHPSRDGERSDRIATLRRLREMGYEIGSGIMVCLPGQSLEDIAEDILLFGSIGLDMIGVGPYMPHPHTPLFGEARTVDDAETMTYKVIALARLVCPLANIPSTTALATINPATGRELGLLRGANVLMPNLNSPERRAMYEIYPDKESLVGDPLTADPLRAWIAGLGRTVGCGPGHSRSFEEARS